MSGKGDTPRPLSVDNQTFASNWDAVFGRKPAQELVGSAQVPSRASNTRNEGAIPSSPAILGLVRMDAFLGIPSVNGPIYIDPESGAQVDENWWPGDPVGYGVQ